MKKLVIQVALRFDRKTPTPINDPGRWYRPVRRIPGRHSLEYSIVGLHWILKGWEKWRYHRWILEELLLQIGWMEGDHYESPTYSSLRFGSPWRILEEREEERRRVASDARDYAIRRAREEGARLTAEQVDELKKAISAFDDFRAGYKAHAASVAALVSISLALPVPWAGEVDNYDDIVRAVVDVVEDLDRHKKAAAIAAESVVGLGQ